jgi:putative transposase
VPYYHVWFGTKRRKWLLQGDVLEAATEIVRQIAMEKGIHLSESAAIVDHLHLLLDLTTKSELPVTMMLIKGVSARRIFEQFPELKLDAHTNSFWQVGHGAKLVPPAALDSTREYIRTQWDRLEGYDRSDSLPRGSARGTLPTLKQRKRT